MTYADVIEHRVKPVVRFNSAIPTIRLTFELFMPIDDSSVFSVIDSRKWLRLQR